MQQNELPEGWMWTEVKHLGVLINGDRGKNYPSNKHYVDSGIPFINAGNLLNGKVSIENLNFISDERYKLLSSGKLIDGDIIYCLRGTLGKCAVFSGMKNGAIASSLVILRINEATINSYMYYFLTSPFGKKLIKNFDNGTAQPNLSAKSLSNYPVPLPPLLEQHRIVAAIEALFARLDATNERLDRVLGIMKAFRQAVLAAACDGRLTEDWREEQKDLPDARELLEQIHRERENAAKASGKKVKSVKALSEDEVEELPKLADGWGWVKLGYLVEEPKYGTSKKCDYNIEGIGVLRIPNIGNGIINDYDLKYAQFDSTEIESYELRVGDILTIRSNGSVDLVGKCALIGIKDEKYLYAGYLIKLRPIGSLIDSKYLLNCLSSIDLRNQIELKAKSTSGVNNINSGELQSLIIPLCSLPEQQEIVRRVDALFAFADSIEAKVAVAREKTEKLRQSILAKAFSGELVPTEAELARQESREYESAEVLLKRIKAEGKSGKK